MPVDTANQADGLGDRGEAPGTSALGVVDGFPSTYGGSVTIALSDSGAAMAAWSMADSSSTSSSETISWSTSNGSSAWTPAARLTQAGTDRFFWTGLTLKANTAGNFALGWGHFQDFNIPRTLRAIRYTSGTWEKTLYDFAGGSKEVKQNAVVWDLNLLADNSMVSAATFHNQATDKNSQAIIRINPAGATTIPAQTDPVFGMDTQQYNYFAPLTNGSGLFIYTEQVLPTSTFKIFARLASVANGQFAAQEIGSFTGSLCAPLTAATSASGRTTLALVTANCSELHLINVDVLASTIVTDHQVIPDGSRVPFSSPRVVVDAAGNALAVWTQITADGNAILKWSAAPLNGNWSTPADLIQNLARLGQLGRNSQIDISLAMNPAGQAVAAVRLAKDVSGSNNEFIVVSRYTVAGGWQEWKAVANKAVLNDPIVSINAQGNAIVGYRSRDSTRRNGTPLINTGTTVPDKVFALKF